MDSGNSGSLQSSSGGEEEYDSRAESSAPAFFNNIPPTHYGSMSNPRPSFFQQYQNHQANMFDLSSNYLHPFSQPQPNSNPNSTDLGNLPPDSSSFSMNKLSNSVRSSSPAAPELNQGSIRPDHDNGARATAQRNSKKRTRATRRAPTTVLTTDTSNFRAMVQEFTGIPSPPFSGSPYSRRLDLFGTSSALRSGTFYPLRRPSAEKVQPSPFVMSSSSSSASTSMFNHTMVVDATNVANSTLNNYHQVPSNLGLIPRQPQSMLNMQNPNILTFQSLPQPHIPGFGSPSPGSLALPFLEELGMNHGQANLNLGGLPNHGAGLNDGRSSQEHLRPLDGNYGNSPRVGGCKLNYSASSSSDFNVHDKSLENVSGRGEGTVDSWLCHSG